MRHKIILFAFTLICVSCSAPDPESKTQNNPTSKRAITEYTIAEIEAADSLLKPRMRDELTAGQYTAVTKKFMEYMRTGDRQRAYNTPIKEFLRGGE